MGLGHFTGSVQRLVDFAIGLVNSVLNLPNGKVKFFQEFKLHKNCVINPAYQRVFGAC